MNALLICPAIRPAVPGLAEDGPLALAPILGECVASLWLEHLAALGARHVWMIAADRAEQVRAALGDGARWGLQLEVVAAGTEPTPAEAAARHRPALATGWLAAPHDVVLMNHLPGAPGLPLFDSYASWFAALLAWMPRALTPARVRVHELAPGIWVGRRAHVSSRAKLIAPCWIGDQAFVEPGAIVGPEAIVEDRSVVESEAQVSQSWVGPDTFVGPMTAVATSLAWGGTLTNWRTDSSLRVPDPFLLCSLARAPTTRAARPATVAERARRAPAHANPSPLSWIDAWPEPARRVQDSHPPA